ncbi:protein of unknown function [Streptomyces murinus]
MSELRQGTALSKKVERGGSHDFHMSSVALILAHISQLVPRAPFLLLPRTGPSFRTAYRTPAGDFPSTVDRYSPFRKTGSIRGESIIHGFRVQNN